jgi:hypothetical protein
MERAVLVALTLVLAALPTRSFGQAAEIAVDVAPPIPNISSELLDPQGLSRFHLVSRAVFSDDTSFTTDVEVWSWEARANIRIAPGLSLAANLPFGLLVPGTGQQNQFFFGNFSVGVAGGGNVLIGGPDDVSIAVGGALDIYAPTAPEPEREDLSALGAAQARVASMRAYEPQLYLSNQMSFRARGLGRLRAQILTAELELGFIPTFTLDSQSEFGMLFGVAARIAVLPIRAIEPYVEVSGTVKITGDSELKPPYLVTPGVRFHIADTLDPAIFVSFNFVHSSAIIFGIDLAGALRPSVRGGGDMEDFFDGF